MKKAIRKEILTKRKTMSVETIEQKSKEIIDKVIVHPQYQNADTVFVYVDAKGEVKTQHLIEDAWKKGKVVAVPKVHGEIMKFYRITSFNDLESGYFGILEPKEECEEINIFGNSVVIMPGVAFDKDGNRIGYGKGYYDKYFSQYTEVYKIAIAFSMQIVPQIPADEFDIKANCVITE